MFPEDLTERSQFIANQVRAGNYQHQWVNLGEGLEVSADALMIDGIRVTVSARTQAQIAQMLNAQLPSQIVMDLRHQASLKLPPIILPISTSVASMVRHSQLIDEAIAKHYPNTDLTGRIISDLGKSWLLHPSGKVCNYGLLTSSPVYQGIRCEASTLPGLWAIQGLGFCHDENHTDWSQIAIFARIVS